MRLEHLLGDVSVVVLAGVDQLLGAPAMRYVIPSYVTSHVSIARLLHATSCALLGAVMGLLCSAPCVHAQGRVQSACCG